MDGSAPPEVISPSDLTSCGGQINVVPARPRAVPQLVDVAVDSAVDDVLGPVDAVGVAGRDSRPGYADVEGTYNGLFMALAPMRILPISPRLVL